MVAIRQEFIQQLRNLCPYQTELDREKWLIKIAYEQGIKYGSINKNKLKNCNES